MKMLVCSEGSDQAERAMRLAASIATGCKAAVSLLGITETNADSTRVLESLRKGQAMLESKGVPAELITKSGNPIREIVARTEEAHYDLVVIGAVMKAPGGMFWKSSKSYEIVKTVKPPVMVVTGKDTALRRILICSGGRKYIHSAVQLTGEIARCVGAATTLLHVLPEPPAIYAHLPRMSPSAAGLLASNSELGLHLRKEKETLENLGLETEVRLRDGIVLHEILAEIEEGEYDLVVTGSAPSHGLRTYLLGDVTREIVNRARSAVLVVRSAEKIPGSGATLRGLFRR